MPAPLSIVIPTLNGQDRLGPVLGALYEAVEIGLLAELIIVDGGDTPEIAEIAEEVGARYLTCASGRGRQLGHGADAAQGAWLLFVHDDTCLAGGWAKEVAAHIGNDTRAAYFRLRFSGGGAAARLVAGWANLRSRVLGRPFGDQGLLVSRKLYSETGGYQRVALMEDVLLARRLGRSRLRPLRSVASTSADRYRHDGWVRRGARNLWFQLLFACGVSPDWLARRYQGR